MVENMSITGDEASEDAPDGEGKTVKGDGVPEGVGDRILTGLHLALEKDTLDVENTRDMRVYEL